MPSLRYWNRVLLTITGVGLAGGGVASALGTATSAAALWAGTTGLVLAVLVIQSIAAVVRGSLGVDLVAALAMAGALTLGQPLAGAVIAVMFAGGGALEEFAQARSRRELSALLGRAPRVAHRIDGDALADIAVAVVAKDDRLLVKAGEVVPVDGILASPAVLDESALTGEAMPVSRGIGDQVRSGVVNGGDAFSLVALAPAADSTYAAIVRLVEEAEKSKAPFVRLADRFALLFIPLTLAVAGAAWLLSGDPVRGLAVLVVATPCPLILAVPVAIISGISRAARRGILVKTGGALEALARAEVLLLDKTGTLTGGIARLVSVEPVGTTSPHDLLRWAASLDQASQHIMAVALVAAARERGLSLPLPTDVREQPGAGIAGVVEGHRIAVGHLDWLRTQAEISSHGYVLQRRVARHGLAGVFVAVDEKLAGAILLADEIRPDSAAALRHLRKAGIRRVVMVSGDRADVAETIGFALGLDAVLAERSPEDKVGAVLEERKQAVTIMVGDGINDAPALAAADIGVALGARGAAAASEAADVVMLVDRLDRLAEGMTIARRSRRLALQSVVVGMVLSAGAMVLAAIGLLTPIAGAVTQEVVDVVVILNALRALRQGEWWQRPESLSADTARELTAQHGPLADVLDRIRMTADRLDAMPAEMVIAELAAVDALLAEKLVPHEREDDLSLYPRLARMLGGSDPMASMSRAHREILHLVRLLGRLVADLDAETLATEDIREARRILYSLEAVLGLHVAQEEELFYALGAADDA